MDEVDNIQFKTYLVHILICSIGWFVPIFKNYSDKIII